MKLEDLEQSGEKLMRIIQETVPGKQVTMAHVIASPNTVIYQKLGLDPKIDYAKAAIGILTMTPSETSIIAADIALKKSGIDIGFIDRFSGTLIITGKISDVTTALEAVLNYAENVMGFTVCNLTKA
ncbi:BMC domain-containing protein [Caproiciproducens faecalis]